MEPVIVAKFSAAVAAGGAIMFILVKLLSGGTEEIEINEVIFSSPKSAGCNSNTEECNCENLQCFFKNVSRIERYLDEAKCTISLAMYMLTTRRLMEALLRAKRRGVRVRIITDGTMFRNSACLMRELKNSGVPVRASPTNEKSLMHHKYCLIDAPCLCDASGNCSCNQQLKDANNPTAMLIIGSANWTTQAFSSNYENVFITSSRSAVLAYQYQFQTLWDEMVIPMDTPCEIPNIKCVEKELPAIPVRENPTESTKSPSICSKELKEKEKDPTVYTCCQKSTCRVRITEPNFEQISHNPLEFNYGPRAGCYCGARNSLKITNDHGSQLSTRTHSSVGASSKSSEAQNEVLNNSMLLSTVINEEERSKCICIPPPPNSKASSAIVQPCPPSPWSSPSRPSPPPPPPQEELPPPQEEHRPVCICIPAGVRIPCFENSSPTKSKTEFHYEPSIPICICVRTGLPKCPEVEELEEEPPDEPEYEEPVQENLRVCICNAEPQKPVEESLPDCICNKEPVQKSPVLHYEPTFPVCECKPFKYEKLPSPKPQSPTESKRSCICGIPDSDGICKSSINSNHTVAEEEIVCTCSKPKPIEIKPLCICVQPVVEEPLVSDKKPCSSKTLVDNTPTTCVCNKPEVESIKSLCSKQSTPSSCICVAEKIEPKVVDDCVCVGPSEAPEISKESICPPPPPPCGPAKPPCCAQFQTNLAIIKEEYPGCGEKKKVHVKRCMSPGPNTCVESVHSCETESDVEPKPKRCPCGLPGEDTQATDSEIARCCPNEKCTDDPIINAWLKKKSNDDDDDKNTDNNNDEIDNDEIMNEEEDEPNE